MLVPVAGDLVAVTGFVVLILPGDVAVDQVSFGNVMLVIRRELFDFLDIFERIAGGLHACIEARVIVSVVLIPVRGSPFLRVYRYPLFGGLGIVILVVPRSWRSLLCPFDRLAFIVLTDLPLVPLGSFLRPLDCGLPVLGLDVLDDTFKSADDVERTLGMALLGRVPAGVPAGRLNRAVGLARLVAVGRWR